MLNGNSPIGLRELGERLKQARIARGLTQEQLGLAVGVTRAAVSQWEAGQVQATLQNLQAAAESLQINLARFLSHDPNQHHVAPRPGRRSQPSPPHYDGVVTEMTDADGSGSRTAGDWWRLPPQILRDLFCSEKGAKIFHVRGASMEPTINRGAYILVDISQSTPHDGQVYVIHNGITFVLKRLHIRRDAKRKALVDLSSDGSPRVTTLPMARVKIVGRVMAQLLRPL
jgi:transcriptional regulator with XRE-family HTH domain